MNFQEKIINLSEYKLGFNIYNGYTIINITYPKEWSVIKPDNKDITFAQDEVHTETYFYSAPITCDMSVIFNCIEATIEFNKEMEKKIALFQEKQKELQNIFIEESYETLESLTFSFKKKKNKKNVQKTNATVEENTQSQSTEELNNEMLSVEEIKGGTTEEVQPKQQNISKHSDSLEMLPGEETCEDVIISNYDLNNGNY